MDSRNAFDIFMERLHYGHREIRRYGLNPYEFNVHINPEFHKELSRMVPPEYLKEWTEFIPFILDPGIRGSQAVMRKEWAI